MLWVFEGPDGVGKSTLIKAMKESLENKGNVVYTTYAPNTDIIHRYHPKSASEELAAFLFDYTYHVNSMLDELFDDDAIVLCDRWVPYSSSVYQGAKLAIENNIPLEEALNTTLSFYANVLSSSVFENIVPTVTVYIKGDMDIIKERITKRGEIDQRFENDERLKRVVAMYNMLFEQEMYKLLPQYDKTIMIELPADMPVEEKVDTIWRSITDFKLHR